MKQTLKLMLIALLLAGPKAFAQELVPATSEDIQEFDRQIQQHKKTPPVRKDNFGSQVSEEAKKLKDSDDSENFGKWVSSQRKKNDQDRPGAQGSIGNGNGSGNSGKGSSASDSAPGKQKKGKRAH